MTTPRKSTAIGIDLGTTHCCVTAFRHNALEVIENEHGKRLTPSCVAFDPEERTWFVGKIAKKMVAGRYPRSVVFDVKRMIGRRYGDAAVQSNLELWPFRIVDDDGYPKVTLPDGEGEMTVTPEDLTAKILEKLKGNAEVRLDEDVVDAVVAVPASFSDCQRRATLEAASRAGLRVLRLLNEPTAAALAYGYDMDDLDGRIMVFDFGGGTLDVSIVRVKDQTYTVLATTGNDRLGGEDIANNLVRYVLEECKRATGVDLARSVRRLARVRADCESHKKHLSFQSSTSLLIENVAEGADFELELTRAKFEEINGDVFAEALDTVKRALEIAHLTKEDVDRVVMVGGSSRIPKLAKLLADFFGGAISVLKNVQADEAIAHGAAIIASVLNGTYEGRHKEVILVDVIPRSLGIEVEGGEMSVVLPRCSEVPCEKTERYETTGDDQTCINLLIYEGDDERVANNYFLRMITVDVPRDGLSKIEVTFSVDACGILTVTANDLTSENSTDIAIDRHLRQL